MKENKKFGVDPATQLTLFDEISNTENDANCADNSHGYITYYKEFDIVIISGTRSNTHADSRKSLGFIDCSASRINVALSRARKVLVMVADADTYRRNSHFSNFIEYVKDEGYYGI